MNHLASIPRSHVIRSAAPAAAVAMALSLSLGAYDEMLAKANSWPALPHVSLALLSLTGTTLSLVLVFRTNQSYR
jgi:predicted membrane chloride channel (bestrophin family)